MNIKKILIIFTLACISYKSYAQSDSIQKSKETFNLVEEMAKPKDGIENFYKWFAKNVEYPKLARKKGIEGKVMVKLLVDVDGKMKDFVITKGIGAGCDEETIRVLSLDNAPLWIPAKQGSKLVKMKVSMPFFFKPKK